MAYIPCQQYVKIMERLADKTKEELIKIKDEYVKKYIGDF